MTRTVVEIERLVIRGFDRREHAGLVRRLRHEIGEILADPYRRQQLVARGDTPHLRMDGIRLERGAEAEQVVGPALQTLTGEGRRRP